MVGGLQLQITILSRFFFLKRLWLIEESSTFPFISRAASFASAGLSKVTKAKPLDLFVSRSFIKRTAKMKYSEMSACVTDLS